jgi:ATP-binding cassette subfamily B protein
MSTPVSVTEPVVKPDQVFLPPAVHREVAALLSEGENVLASFEVDLDAQLRFAQGRVVLCEHQLLARAPGEARWQAWPLHPTLRLQHFDHAGVATLELIDDQGRLAAWRYTLAQNLVALRLIDQFEERIEILRCGHAPAHGSDEICLTCKAPLPPGEDECPICWPVSC